MNFILIIFLYFSLFVNFIQTNSCCSSCPFGSYESVDISIDGGNCNYFSQWGYSYNITNYKYLDISIYDDYSFTPSDYSLLFSIQTTGETVYFSYLKITNGDTVASRPSANNIKYITGYNNYILDITFLIQSNQTIYNMFKNKLAQLDVTFFCDNTAFNCDMNFNFNLYNNKQIK